jgi:hypothetical protein
MLNINLNLPTLPTQDQKDAMDGANAPDATNVFLTANDITASTLQEVTDLGNTTTNDIQLINDAEVIFGAGGGVLLDNGSRLREGTIDAGFGGSKGISQICAVGYELKWEAGRLYVMDGNGLLIRHSLYNFTTIPSANDDSTKGYYVGSLWSLDNGVSYICTDSTSTAATWDIYEDYSLLVPYTGANADVNLGEFGIQLGNLEFDNTPTNVPTGAGSLNWNDTDGTLDLKLKGGNVTLQIGQEQVTRVVNKTATNITLLEANYQAVRITGAQGQRLKVDLALATTDVLSAETIGLVTETIANNQEGFITTSGLLRGVNTTGSLQSETWADGDILYLSGTTAGRITNIKPTAPIHLIVIGYVVYSHITQGTIYVKVDNGYELNELHNVYINGVADKNLLAYESSTSLWKNKTANTLGIAELASPTFTGTVTSPAIVLSSETASTIASFDASKNVKSLSTATYPSLTELSYVKGVTSAIQTQLNTKGFTLQGGWATTNPADATTYYAGSIVAALVTASNNMLGFYIPKNCTLKSAYINIICNSATTEAVTYNAYIGGSAYLLTTNNTASTSYTISATGLSISCTTGQLVLLQIVTPTWATNPTSQRGSFTFYFE